MSGDYALHKASREGKYAEVEAILNESTDVVKLLAKKDEDDRTVRPATSDFCFQRQVENTN